jgi:hypothetical protein
MDMGCLALQHGVSFCIDTPKEYCLRIAFLQLFSFPFFHQTILLLFLAV